MPDENYDNIPSFKKVIREAMTPNFKELEKAHPVAVNFLIEQTLEKIGDGPLPPDFSLREVIQQVTDSAFLLPSPDEGGPKELKGLIKDTKTLLKLASATEQSSMSFDETLTELGLKEPQKVEEEYASTGGFDKVDQSGNYALLADLRLGMVPDVLKSDLQGAPQPREVESVYTTVDPRYKRDTLQIESKQELMDALLQKLDFKREIDEDSVFHYSFKDGKNPGSVVAVVKACLDKFPNLDGMEITTDALKKNLHEALRDTLPLVFKGFDVKLDQVIDTQMVRAVLDEVRADRERKAETGMDLEDNLESEMSGAPDVGASSRLPNDQNYGTIPTGLDYRRDRRGPDPRPATSEEYTEINFSDFNTPSQP